MSESGISLKRKFTVANCAKDGSVKGTLNLDWHLLEISMPQQDIKSLELCLMMSGKGKMGILILLILK